MPSITCHVVSEKTALIPLDDLFPECAQFSSERTPRLVCLPEPNACAACSSLPALIRRLQGIFTASGWEMVVLYWFEGDRVKGVVSLVEDPAEVRLLVINKSSLYLLKEQSESYIIDLPLYS